MKATIAAPAPAAARPNLYDFAEGFGSVYGRYVRNDLSRRLIAQYGIRTVLEAPCNAESYFASPGTQSVIFAQEGCAVTLLHPEEEIVEKTRDFWAAIGMGETPVLHHTRLDRLPFEDGQFDLVWNFDYIPLLADPVGFVAEMARVSRKLVLVIVPNYKNVGYPIHALMNAVKRRPSAWGARRWMAIGPVRRAMRAAGMQVAETGLVDMPPWPGFDALNLLGQLVRKSTVQSGGRERSDEEIEQMLSKMTFIEHAPLPRLLKVPFSHQLFVIGRKQGA